MEVATPNYLIKIFYSLYCNIRILVYYIAGFYFNSDGIIWVYDFETWNLTSFSPFKKWTISLKGLLPAITAT